MAFSQWLFLDGFRQWQSMAINGNPGISDTYLGFSSKGNEI